MNWTGTIWTLQWSLILERFTEVSQLKYQEWLTAAQHLRSLSEDINEEQHGAENALWWINFSKLRIEFIFWEIALKKATELSAGGGGGGGEVGREHFLSCVHIYMCVILWGITLICIAQYCQHPAVIRKFRLLPQGKCSRRVYSLTTYLRMLTTTALFTVPSRKRQILLNFYK